MVRPREIAHKKCRFLMFYTILKYCFLQKRNEKGKVGLRSIKNLKVNPKYTKCGLDKIH